MGNIQIFNSNEFGDIRVVNISNNPFFNLKDVCRILDIKNPSDAKTRLSQGGVVTTEVGVQTGIKSNGTPAIQKVQATFINESNLYKLIFQSRKPQAERFTDWVTSEVLPMIRQTGMYMTDNIYDAIMQDPTKFGELLIDYGRVKEENKKQKEKIEQDRPKVLFADAVNTSKTSILIGDLAKLLKQNGYNTGQKRLFEELRQRGYLIKSGSSKNMPTQKAMEMGLFEVKENTIVKPDDSVIITKTTKVTGTGQLYFINLFLKEQQEVK